MSRTHRIKGGTTDEACQALQEQSYGFLTFNVNLLRGEPFFRSPEKCLKLERWQGLPHINIVKQYEIVSSFKVSLFIQFFQS